jgi:hypothetical protein
LKDWTLAHLELIARARRQILIANAYFIPSRQMIAELRRAARRGVRVVILTNSPETNDISSVGYWYQTEPHKQWPALPSGPERLPFTDRIIAVGADLVPAVAHSEPPIQVQDLPGRATNGKQLFLTPADDKAWVEIPFTVARDTRAFLVGKLSHSWDSGTYRASLDGHELEVMDLYRAAPTPREHKWGMRELRAGPHVLRLQCVGRPDRSKGYFLGFDALAMRVPAYTRPAGKDLRDLQAVK